MKWMFGKSHPSLCRVLNTNSPTLLLNYDNPEYLNQVIVHLLWKIEL